MRNLLICSLIFPCVAYSQPFNISGYVYDNSGHSLQYVNVVSLTKNIGTVTNDIGYFSLKIEKVDSVKFSHIAYLSKIISVNNYISDTVFLEDNYRSLNEVVISSHETHMAKSRVGFYNKDDNGEFLLSPGNQIAVFIENPNKESGWIKSITFCSYLSVKAYMLISIVAIIFLVISHWSLVISHW